MRPANPTACKAICCTTDTARRKLLHKYKVSEILQQSLCGKAHHMDFSREKRVKSLLKDFLVTSRRYAARTKSAVPANLDFRRSSKKFRHAAQLRLSTTISFPSFKKQSIHNQYVITL